MSRKDKLTVLIAMIIITIGFGGCSCQVQMGGTGNKQISKPVAAKKYMSYHDRLVSGKVSIEESIQRAKAK